MTEKNVASAKKRRRKIGCIVLLVLLALLIAGAFKVKLLQLPKCIPDTQEEVDWPPAEPGVYEKESSNKLRELDFSPRLPFTPPTRIAVCNVRDSEATDTFAWVPAEPQLLLINDDVAELEYHLFHSVDLPDTGVCGEAESNNEIEGLVIAFDQENEDWVWITPPVPFEPEQTYMLTASADSPDVCNTGADEVNGRANQECWGVILRVGVAE